MPESISFGKWLRQRRRTLDLTQKALANQVGCAEITVRQIEADVLKPSKELAESLLKRLDIPELERPEWLRFARGLSSAPQKSIDGFISFRQSTNLPVALTSFVGRENERNEIIRLIAKNRLVTLAGAGGIGKTRLSFQIGQKIMNDFPDGVWFVAFDSLSNPMLVPQTVAFVFDIREEPDRPVIELLKNILRQKTMLLILDNCDHLLDACAQLIKTLLINCPNLKILSTSREILNMEGEAIYYLPSLSIPENEGAFSKKTTEFESVRLFEERAKFAASAFQLTKQNTQTVGNICRRLDGIPLAIELAAAQTDVLQLNEILKQLNLCFDLLASKRRAVLPRHQTMRASMDWSWRLLNFSEQSFIRQLSVFAGGWTLESAQTVCEGNTLNLISALVKKSLIVVDQQTGRETRYRFHEIIRQYAREKLVESGEEEEIRNRHLKYFLELSELAESALKGPAQIEWMARLNDERDNIRAALAWADQTNTEAGLYISSRLERFWESFDIREENYWLSTFLQKPESLSYPRARAMALHAHLPVLNLLNQIDLWRSTAKECLELYRTLGDRHGEVDVLLITAGELSSAAQRMEVFHQAYEIGQALGDIWRQARALLLMGWGCNGDEKLDYWKQAITLFRQSGDWRSLAYSLGTTATFAVLNDKLELAQESLDEATILNNQLKDKVIKANLLYVYGKMAMVREEYDQAHLYFNEQLEILGALGIRLSLLFARTQLGFLTLREGNLAEAHYIFSETAHNFRDDHNLDGVAFALEGMAGFCVAIDKPVIAAQLIGWADATRKKIDDIRPRLEQADVDKIITACIIKMGEAAFSDAYDEGQKMSMDEAVALALN